MTSLDAIATPSTYPRPRTGWTSDELAILEAGVRASAPAWLVRQSMLHQSLAAVERRMCRLRKRLGMAYVRAPSPTWPPAAVAILRQMWADGEAASAIAERLGRGLTRCSVLGKVHRLGLSRSESRTRIAGPKISAAERKRRYRAKKRAEAQKPMFAPRPPPEPAPVAIEPRHLSFAELEPAYCRYPYGDGPEFSFCGLKKADGSSYCGYHARLVYKPRDR